MSRLTLAQQIAQLEDTVPDYDPEDAYNATESNGLLDRDQAFGADDAAREHYVEVGSSSLRKLHESAPDTKYNAVKTSRSKVFDDDEDTPDEDALGGDLAKFAILTGPADYDEDEDEENEEDEDEEMGEEGVEQKDEDEEDEEAYRPSKPFGKVHEESDGSQSGAEEDEEEKDETSRSPKSQKKADDDGGDRHLADALRKTREQDRAKGKAVAKQLATWDTLLDARIRLQKSVVAANRLPLPENISQFTSKDAKANNAVEKLLEATLSLSEDVMELRELYMKTNEPDVELPPRKKRKLDVTSPTSDSYASQVREATASASALESAYHRSLLQTLRKWSAKVQAVAPSTLSSGKSFQHTSGGVKSAVDLIDETLSGGKAVARTRVRRSEGKRVVSMGDEDGVHERGVESLDVDEVFDDADFYQQLLRDVIDSRGGAKDSHNVDAEDAWARKQKRAQKAERALANKDKRVRYDVHEKLQNFMVPIPIDGMRGTWHEEQIDELFSSLLGKGFEGAAQESMGPIGLVSSSAVVEEQETSQQLAIYMKGPTVSAVFNATRILIESIHEENKDIREATLNQENVTSQQRSLDDANDKISALESTFDAVRGEFASKIQEARRQRNALLPISRLPRELLARIFYIYCDTYSRLNELKTLASVCSSWSTLVRSTPALWSILESNCPLDLLPTVIRNSRSSPLTVRVIWPSFGSCNPPEDAIERYCQFFEIVAADASLTDRWTAVSMQLPPNVGPVKDYLEIPLPNLKRALLRNEMRRWTQDPVKLFGGNSGSLEEFELDGIPVQWDFLELRGLRLLSLRNEAPSSSMKLLEMLAASPGLESLALSDLPNPSHSEQDLLTTVTLPKLKRLSLYDNEEKFVVILLQAIRTPALDRFELVDDRFRRQDYGEAFVSALHTFGHVIPTLQSITFSAHTINLELGGDRFKFGASAKRASNDWGFYIDLQTKMASNIFTWMSNNIQIETEDRSPVYVYLTFHSGWAADYNDMTAFLPVMHWVGDVNIAGLVLNDGNITKTILEWLSGRFVQDDLELWRCPGLTKLEIGSTVYLDDLRKFARKRYPEGVEEDEDMPEDEDPDVERPELLDTLDVPGLWQPSDDEEDYSGYFDAEDELCALFGCKEVTG
ncbi:rRNA-processing protein bfr2, partial [Tulasnella sp. 427]